MNGEDTDTDNEALAATALQHFKERNATKALDCLTKLRSKGKENDPKILHNISITEYYLNGSSDPQKLLDDFNKVKTIITEKAANQAENGDVQDETSTPEDIDTALLQYNQAVILYQTRKYASALEILTRLNRTIEPIEDYLAVRICFLLVDIYLLLKQTEKGLAVMTYLDKLYANLTKPVEDKSAQEKEEREKEKERNEKEKKEVNSETLFQKPEPLPPSTHPGK